MSDELVGRGVNQLQMWILILVGGLLRETTRGRKSLSAADVAIELCVKKSGVANEFAELSSRNLIVAFGKVPGTDRRKQTFELTYEGLELARELRKLLQTVEKELLIFGGWRASDRAVDPQYLLLGLWIAGRPDARLPTLGRVTNAPSGLNAGTKRGEDAIRVKKAWLPLV